MAVLKTKGQRCGSIYTFMPGCINGVVRCLCRNQVVLSTSKMAIAGSFFFLILGSLTEHYLKTGAHGLEIPCWVSTVATCFCFVNFSVFSK